MQGLGGLVAGGKWPCRGEVGLVRRKHGSQLLSKEELGPGREPAGAASTSSWRHKPGEELAVPTGRRNRARGDSAWPQPYKSTGLLGRPTAERWSSVEWPWP